MCRTTELHPYLIGVCLHWWDFKAKDCTVEGWANGSGRKVLALQTGGPESEDQHPDEIHGTHL